MTRALILAVVVVTSTFGSGSVPVPFRLAHSRSCGGYSWSHPPARIRVLRSHHRGSGVPKHIETWRTDRYVAAVMASGAWPNRVWESAKVGAIAIRQYTLWTAIHTCRTWEGHRYDIADTEQYLRPGMGPHSHLPVRTLRAVRTMRSVTLTKHGHRWRTGWSGGSCDDGFHACEDSVRAMAERGYGWRSIVRHYLSPVRIMGRPA
jgi:hypothetical protein